MSDAFREVVEKILETPELWEGRAGAGAGANRKGGWIGRDEGKMPGNIDLGRDGDGVGGAEGGGACGC